MYEKMIFWSNVHTFCQKRSFCYLTTFIESLITHKWFIFEESYISYGKRRKSCTLIVVKVVCLYLLPLIYNLSTKIEPYFLSADEEVHRKKCEKIIL